MITRVEDISRAYWPLVHLFGWSVVKATGIVLVRFSGCLLAASLLDICCYLFVHQYFFLNLVSSQYFDPPGNHAFLTNEFLSSFSCVFSFSSLLDRCEWPKLRVLWFPSWYFLTHCIFEDHLLELSSSETNALGCPYFLCPWVSDCYFQLSIYAPYIVILVSPTLSQLPSLCLFLSSRYLWFGLCFLHLRSLYSTCHQLWFILPS